MSNSPDRVRLDPAAGEALRRSFTVVATALAGVSLTDSENGEVLGIALDIVDRVDDLARQPVPDPAGAVHALAVVLAPGALDALRRASEFQRVPGPAAPSSAELVYIHDGGMAVRIIVARDGTRARVEVR